VLRVWERFKEPKSKTSKAPVPMRPLLAGFLLAWFFTRNREVKQEIKKRLFQSLGGVYK